MDQERRNRSLNKLESLQLGLPADFAIAYPEDCTEIRPINDIIKRSIALYCLATYADSLLQGNCSRDEAFAFAGKFIKRYNADDFFTEKEKHFLELQHPTSEEIGVFCWKWESLYALLYCLSFINDIGLPTEPCKIPLCSKAFARNRTTDAFTKASKLRNIGEILDFADLIFSCTQASNKSSFESGVLGGWYDVIKWIVIQNGKAINWDDL